jgi:hypothetical protein
MTPGQGSILLDFNPTPKSGTQYLVDCPLASDNTFQVTVMYLYQAEHAHLVLSGKQTSYGGHLLIPLNTPREYIRAMHLTINTPANGMELTGACQVENVAP